jgi:uncharacterized protein YjbJ (UPF0337 family)
MSTPQKRKQQIEQKIRETEDILGSEADKIPDRIYSALEGMSSLALAWKQHGGASGWSQTLVDNDGNQLFSESESDLIETGAEKARPFLDSFLHEGQTGGATGALPTGPAMPQMPQMGMNPEDVSIDKMYYGLLSKLDSYDTQWRDIVNNLGVIKTFNETDQVGVIPFVPPIPYMIPAKLKFPIINTILELLRIMVSSPFLDMPNFRVLLSFGIAILDLVRGEWKHAVLSLFGAYSMNAMYIGIIGKIIRDAWLLIAPDLRTDLTDAIFKSTKSFVAGFILWAFGTFAPGSMQKIIQTALDKAAEQVENFNKQIEDLEAKVGDVSKTAGITVSFKRVPEGMVPSLDDIQRLQTIARVPAIFCSDEFQKIIEPLLLIPPLRLALELFNIPTIPETKEKMCSGVPKGSIADTVGDAADPDVGIIPGGPADQAQKAASQVQEAAGQVQEAVADAQKQVEGAASFLENPKKPQIPTQAIGSMVGGKKSRTRKNKKSTK